MNTTKLGAAIGNWNDRHNGGDTRTTHRRPRPWRVLDALAGRLYVRGDRGGR